MAKIAKYQIVEQSIQDAICNGSLKVGDQLWTEEELCAKFGFSRTTVGKALDNLRAHGYIERIAGRGTFVRAAHVEKQAGSCSSFTEDMASIGLKAGARLISYEVLRSDDIPEIAGKLQMSGNELVHHFVRLRTGNDRPIAIGYTYIRGSVIPAIDVSSLDGSFYSYARSLGLNIQPADQVRICAVLPTADQLKLLEADGIALLRSAHVNRVVADGHAVPFEYTETYYNSEMFSFTAHDPQAFAMPPLRSQGENAVP